MRIGFERHRTHIAFSMMGMGSGQWKYGTRNLQQIFGFIVLCTFPHTSWAWWPLYTGAGSGEGRRREIFPVSWRYFRSEFEGRRRLPLQVWVWIRYGLL